MKREIKVRKTERGFGIGNFKDANGESCSIQVSSAMQEEYLLWLGCDEIGLKRFEPGKGWIDVHLEQNHPYGVTHNANTRMHLTQTMVRDLLPLLRNFAATGRLAYPKSKCRKQAKGAKP